MNTPETIEAAFSAAELCFDALSQALVSGEPVQLSECSAKLQRAALHLSLLLGRLAVTDPRTPFFKARLTQLASGLNVRRESLIRRTVLVDRALNALVPSTVKTTYGASPKAYAAVGKQTGAFTFLIA